jgi:branched-chain amino acid transport system permease protein
MIRALRQATIAALVALGLFFAMVGIKMDPGETHLALRFRPGLVAILVACVFVLRLLQVLWSGRTRREAVQSNRRLAEAATRVGRVVAPALLAFALVLPLFAGRYYLDLGVLVLTYIMLGWGLNIVVGLAGLLDLGYVAFYAVGAYTFGLLSTHFGMGFWICLPLCGLFAATAGVLLGFPVLRLRGDYLAIVTLAFGEIIRIVINNWTTLTNGPNGINSIPRPSLLGLQFNASGDPNTFATFFGLEYSPVQRIIFLYYVILGLALLTNWVTLRLRRLPLGRAWEALREDEIACRSLGINVTVTKLTAFAMGATFGGFAGAFFATREGFISPESFTFIESAIVLAIVVLGGLGSQLGVALAAIVMIGGLEVLRDALSNLQSQPQFAWIGSVVGDIGQYRMLIFGLALVVMMVLRPRGLVSGRTPSVALGARKEIAAELVAQGRG